MRSVPHTDHRTAWGYPRAAFPVAPIDGDRLLAGGAVAEGYRRRRALQQRAVALLLAVFAVCLAAILAWWEAAP